MRTCTHTPTHAHIHVVIHSPTPTHEPMFTLPHCLGRPRFRKAGEQDIYIHFAGCVQPPRNTKDSRSGVELDA